jgi:GNAT superfamily N-acetyltransferase
MLRAVHASDGYPARWPEDPLRFLASPGEAGAWVSVVDEEIKGHVALHTHHLHPGVEQACREAGLEPEQVGVVARLLVSPSARRHGIGKELLAWAGAEAHRVGRQPVLDVAQHYAAAIALYEACGWARSGELTYTFPDGVTLEEWFYIGPELRTEVP